MDEPVEKSCNGCRFALFRDYGYSNYTVEGTEFFCLVGARPEDGFDRWFGNDKRLEFGAECPRFTAGDPVEMDVDGEIQLSAEEQALYDAWESSNA